MKLFLNTAPTESADLLIRMHNLVGAAVDITGNTLAYGSRWTCHGCGATSEEPKADYLFNTRSRANVHAAACRAAYHRLG
ncbi:hypothetical protein [Streptomyces roseoverticillatus]|uniref:Uncharacterized protein n=1 Tax=Streptomyces roseoverticillatus TaxID=66429 RepID=A0ABV3J782_9ACTN